MIGIIFDFNGTIYDPDRKALTAGVLNCLEQLSKENSLYMVVKGETDRQILIDSLNIKKFFKLIVLKPEKSVEEFITCKKDADPKTQWYVVGDRVKKEIKYGNQCNMMTIWFKNGKFATEEPEGDIEKPDFIISDIEELVEIINWRRERDSNPR